MTEPKTPVHIWLQDLRDKARLSQSEVDLKTRQLGGRISQSYLSQLEKGYKLLEAMEPPRMDALRQVYGVSVEEWAQRTGLTIVTAESRGPLNREEFLASLPIPDSLREAADLYGARFPDLANPIWQQYLAGFRPRGATADTPEEWLDLYRDLAKHNITPPGVN